MELIRFHMLDSSCFLCHSGRCPMGEAVGRSVSKSFSPEDALLLLLRSPHAYNVDLNKALMVSQCQGSYFLAKVP